MADYKNAGKFERFDAGYFRVGIVVAQFNSHFTEPMLEGARKVLAEYQVQEENIKIIRVAGSIETPVALQALAEKGFDCLVAIGAIIKGETAHFDYVAKVVTDGVLRVGLDYKIPVGFGVITAFTEEQAASRIHHGQDAMVAALHLAKEIKSIKEKELS